MKSAKPETEANPTIAGITEFKNRNYPGKAKIVVEEAPKKRRSIGGLMGAFGGGLNQQPAATEHQYPVNGEP